LGKQLFFLEREVGRLCRYRFSFADALLEVPIILLVLLAAAFLTVFYGWLYDTEKRLAKTQFR
jgi:hypothetical protein